MKKLLGQKVPLSLAQSLFARQVGATALSQGVRLLLSLATASIIARCLGPAGKGQIALIFMIPAVFQLILSGGLGPANVYYAGSGRLPLNQLTANSVVFSMLGTIIGFVLIGVIYYNNIIQTIVPGLSADNLMLGMVALPLGLMNSNLKSILQGIQLIFTLNIINITGALMTFFMMAFFLVGLKYGILGAIIASLTVQAAMVLVVALCVNHKGGDFMPKWNTTVISKTLNFGIKCYIGNVIQFFNYRFDMFIVNFYLGPEGVGIYGVSVLIAELLWQVPNAASFVVFPKSANSTQKTMNRFTPRVFWIILAISFVGATGLAIFGKFIIEILFSAVFLGGYAPLLVLLPGVVLLGGGKVLTSDIAGRGYPQYNAIVSGFSLVLTIILDIMLIPSMGIIGAAIASTISYSFSFIGSLVFYKIISTKLS